MNCAACRAIPYNNNKDYNEILEKRHVRSCWLAFISFSVLATSIISTLGLTLVGIAVGTIGFIGISVYKECSRYVYPHSDYYRDMLAIFSLATAVFSIVSLIPIFTAKVVIASAVIFLVSMIASRAFDGLNAVEYPEHNLLSVAIRTNRLRLVKLSLFLGADPNVRINKEEQPLTALYWACSENRSAIVQTLLRYNANPNPTGFSSPMMFAVNHGNLDLVRILLGAGAHCCEENESNSPTARAINLLSVLSITESHRTEKSEEYMNRKAVLEVLLSHQPVELRTALMKLYKTEDIKLT